jgi:hypothetical protein
MGARFPSSLKAGKKKVIEAGMPLIAGAVLSGSVDWVVSSVTGSAPTSR